MRNAIGARHSFRRTGTVGGGKARLRSSFKRCSSMKEGKRVDRSDNEVKDIIDDNNNCEAQKADISVDV